MGSVTELIEHPKCLKRASVELVEAGPGNWEQRTIVDAVDSPVDFKGVSNSFGESLVDRCHVARNVHAGFDHGIHLFRYGSLLDTP